MSWWKSKQPLYIFIRVSVSCSRLESKSITVISSDALLGITKWMPLFLFSWHQHRFKLNTCAGLNCIKLWFQFDRISFRFVAWCLSGSLGQQPEQGDASLPGHFHQLLWGGHQNVPKPAKRYNFSSMSLICPRVSSQMGMLQTPPKGNVQEESISVDNWTSSTVSSQCGGAAALL